jgi:hypothetical protein
VLFESGFGTGMSTWRKVAPALAIKRGLHADFLLQFSDGTQVVTDKSGHFIQMEQPELVIAAVEKVMAAADRRRQ